MSRVVRSSKYRHVFGTAAKPDKSYMDLRLTRNAWDSNVVQANPYYISVNWDAGGGAFAVIPHEKTGKLGAVPLYSGHKGAVLDTAFNPFNDALIASASEDCTVKIWDIPEGGPTENQEECLITLKGHGRKVGHLAFNPCAANVLASNSPDLTIRLWDIEKGEQKLQLEGHTNMPLDFSWSPDGSQMVSVAKDKTIKLWDPRQQECTASGDSHPGVKGARCTYLGDTGKIFTFGFSKMSERQFSIWDPADLSKPLASTNLDSSSGIIMPFYDDDTKVLYLAGKGDGNIRYYEVVDTAPYVHYLSEYKSSTPQAGMASLTKRAVDVSSCEITRMYKVIKGGVEPISFKVPRKAENFQADIFPDTTGGEPGCGADAWFGGENAVPAKISLEGGFVAVVSTFNAAEQEKEVVADEPKNEKELRKAYNEQKQKITDLENAVEQRDVIVRKLELQLKEAQASA